MMNLMAIHAFDELLLSQFARANNWGGTGMSC